MHLLGLDAAPAAVCPPAPAALGEARGLSCPEPRRVNGVSGGPSEDHAHTVVY